METSKTDGQTDRQTGGGRLIARVAPLIALVLLGALLWQLSSVVLLLFGAAVMAVLLRALSDPLSRRTKLPEGLSLGLVILLILAALIGGGWMFGWRIGAQIDVIFARLPFAWGWIQAHLLTTPIGRYVAKNVNPAAILSGIGLFGRVTAFANTGVTLITDVALVLVGGAYLAVDPQTYAKGFLKLIPAGVRPNVARALGESGEALKSWLFGQLIAMVLIGVLTGVGLAIIGTPSALVLGLFAGLAEFIPLVGPFLGAIPALLIAITVGPHQLLWTAILFVAIQQIEGNAVQPIIQRRMVSVAPVVGLFALAALGVLFGMTGLVLAAPITVVVVVCVKALYLRDVLGEPVDPLGRAQRPPKPPSAATPPDPPRKG